EVAVEMALDLTLGLGDEAEAGTITEERGAGAERERAGVPERVEETRPRAELPEARLAPGEGVRFGARRVHEQRARAVRARHQGLAVVERLRGELAGVVDAHERGALAPRGLRQGLASLGGRARYRAAGARRGEHRAQGAIEGGDSRVEWAAGLHI